MSETKVRSLTPSLPTYRELRHFLRIFNAVPYEHYRSTYDTIWSLRGSPQNQMDWTDPDAWIPIRLDGTEEALAMRVWRESNRELNPRYLRGSWYFSQTHKLLTRDDADILHLTEHGKNLLDGEENLIARLDQYEGLLILLDILIRMKSGKTGDLLPPFSIFCYTYTRYRSESPIKSALRDRLNNLIDRDLVARSGHDYAATAAGQNYLKKYRALLPDQKIEISATPTPENEESQSSSTESEGTATRSLTPGLPGYREARHFLRILNGVSYTLYRGTYNAIRGQRGSPQAQVDWAEPDKWIPARLSGMEADLAMRLWRESNRELNPRYLRGCWYLTTKHDLLQQEGRGKLQITEQGEAFLAEPSGPTVAEIDSYEGVLTILKLVAERGPGRSSEFLPDYTAFCRQFTGYRSETPIRGSLYDRLVNLIQRGYVSRSGQVYEVTDAGLAYLDQYAHLVPGKPQRSRSKLSDLRRLAKAIRQEAREQVAEFLLDMNPFKFEELIQFLLEEMGYRDVETTSPTNDKGVDVVANIELGISSVREVVQAKRYRGTVGRRVLDQLRGSLHRFQAMRGTIITTGRFSKQAMKAAFEPGAAPITLIDGEKLLDLLIEYSIGVSRQTVEYLEFDPTKLAQFETSEAEEPEV